MARPFSSAQFGVNNPNTVLKTDADAEQAWNPLDILKAGDLNGFIAWCTRYAISSSNEIANALTNFQITPNEANESQLSGLLQNLDQKIDNAATAGAIIGSFWFGKTKSATVVPNPNNQAENYYDFTTNTPYKATASLTWEADTPLVPPTNRDARIIITKQFVDIQETENSGGTAYWSYTEGVWSYYPTVATGAVPVGTIVAYSTSTPPTGWLICDGSAISRTTYAALFAVIGTTYGSGDGKSTFNIPDGSGRSIYQPEALNIGKNTKGSYMSIAGTFSHPSSEGSTGCFSDVSLGDQRFSASGSSNRTWRRTSLNLGDSDRIIPSSFYIVFCIKY